MISTAFLMTAWLASANPVSPPRLEVRTDGVVRDYVPREARLRVVAADFLVMVELTLRFTDLPGSGDASLTLEPPEGAALITVVERGGIRGTRQKLELGRGDEARVVLQWCHQPRWRDGKAYVTVLPALGEGPTLHMSVEGTGFTEPPRFAEPYQDLEKGETAALEPVVLELTRGEGDELLTQRVEGEGTYFVSYRMSSPEGLRRRFSRAQTLLLLWDASLSTASHDLDNRLALLARVLAVLKPRHVISRVVRNHPEKPIRFAVVNGTSPNLERQLRLVEEEGCTNLGTAIGDEHPMIDAVLLFSDGIDSCGSERLPRFRAPLFTFGPEAGPGRKRLEDMARASGGVFLGSDPDEAVLRERLTRSLPIPTESSERFRDVRVIGDLDDPDLFTVTGWWRGGRDRELLLLALDAKSARPLSAMVEETDSSPLVRLYWQLQQPAERTSRPLIEPGDAAYGERLRTVWQQRYQAAPTKSAPRPQGIESMPAGEVPGPVTEPSYLQALGRAEPEERYATYLALRGGHMDDPGFFLDCGRFFLEQDDRPTGLRIASNMLELVPDDSETLLTAADFYQSNAAWSAAIGLFRRLADQSVDRAHAFRELALTHVLRGLVWEAARLKTRAIDDYEEARRLYRQIIDAALSADLETGRRFFEGLGLPALTEYHWVNALLARSGRMEPDPLPDPDLNGEIAADLRVVLTWEEPNADIDLLVTEPEAGATDAGQGGHAGPDQRRGPGPEHFTVRRARGGRYLIAARCNNGPTRPVTVKLAVFRDFGEPEGTVRIIRREVQPGTTALLEIIDLEP